MDFEELELSHSADGNAKGNSSFRSVSYSQKELNIHLPHDSHIALSYQWKIKESYIHIKNWHKCL